MIKYIKYKRILLAALLINILLVSTHKGEFWPFSIFPMFSQAGHPWSRGVVQKVNAPSGEMWNTKSLNEIRSGVISLEKHGVNQIDYANFVSKTTNWDSKRLQALSDMLQIDKNLEENQHWLITKVEGHLDEQDSVVVRAIPLFLVSPDTTLRNPQIFN